METIKLNENMNMVEIEMNQVANPVEAEEQTTTATPTATEKKPKAKKATKKAKTAAELQAEIEEKTKALQKTLERLAEKQLLNEHRCKFMETLDNLEQYEKQLLTEDDFETKACRMRFSATDNYRDTDIFSISNVSILLECICFLREKVEKKVRELEKQLLA